MIACRRAPRSTRLRTRLPISSESAARVPKIEVKSTVLCKSPESRWAHLLLVVSNLLFSLLIGMDLLQPHAAKMSLGIAAPLELSAPVCDERLKQRTNPSPSYRSSTTVACVAESNTVALKSASLVTVRLPRAVQDAWTVVIEPLNSTVVIFGCSALPAVCAPVADVCRVAVVNNSDKPIAMLAGFFVASINTVRSASKSSQATATAPRLPHESKLR